METIYGQLPNAMIADNISDLINQVYKLLPFKENTDERLESHFENVLFRISGTARVIETFPEWITVISILEKARTESDFKLYRKSILDSCSILKTIQQRLV